mmetsp:Transcript_77148/g.223933  ORF Transcript_77148/g.223933 Transcript_77148/m.223933 type:complete len:213 (-) Transcript_77148:328-966(-)
MKMGVDATLEEPGRRRVVLYVLKRNVGEPDAPEARRRLLERIFSGATSYEPCDPRSHARVSPCDSGIEPSLDLRTKIRPLDEVERNSEGDAVPHMWRDLAASHSFQHRAAGEDDAAEGKERSHDSPHVPLHRDRIATTHRGNCAHDEQSSRQQDNDLAEQMRGHATRASNDEHSFDEDMGHYASVCAERHSEQNYIPRKWRQTQTDISEMTT